MSKILHISTKAILLIAPLCTGHSVSHIQQGTSLDYVVFPTKLIYQTLIVLNTRLHTTFTIRQNFNTRDINVI